jgi:hypothetical protein
MSKKLDIDDLNTGANGEDRLKLFEPPGTSKSSQVLKEGGRNRAAEARLKSEAATPLLAEEVRRSTSREKTPDLISNCPVCGNPYQQDDVVLALTCLSLAASAGPASLAATRCEPSNKITLGHQGCVLPRLLTLLAGFQPELRFVKASKELSPVSVPSPERCHDKP